VIEVGSVRRPWWLAVVLACLSSLAFASHEEADELERNRRLLDKWKANPDHYQRLKRDLNAFYALPAARQEQIRDLDRQLHEADPETQTRLWGVMERYSVWLEQLPEPERRAVLGAKDKATLIRGLRQREWIERLPRPVRNDLFRLPPEARLARIYELRQQEQQQRVLWQRPLGSTDVARPTKYNDLPAETQTFFAKEVLPRLSEEDKKQLKQTEGNWPDFPKQVSRLADRYPVLPEGPLGKVTKAAQLPPEVKARLEGSKAAKEVARLEGRWPDYALAVTDAVRAEGGPVKPLGASRLEEFPPATAVFVRNRLLPSLNMGEQAELKRSEGRWPDYPRRLLALAQKHHVVIPGMSLPGPQDTWAVARVEKQELSGEQKRVMEMTAGAHLNLEKFLKAMKTHERERKPPTKGKFGHKP
jgi:hypothetical protein